jgi:hypothetical protein
MICSGVYPFLTIYSPLLSSSLTLRLDYFLGGRTSCARLIQEAGRGLEKGIHLVAVRRNQSETTLQVASIAQNGLLFNFGC